MSAKLAKVLGEFGIPINFQAGGNAPERLVEREVHKQPGSCSKKLRNLPIAIDRAKCESCTSFECVANCYLQALQLSGKWTTVDELMRVFDRDRTYWSSGGGVTFGGGEPLMQKEFLISMLRRCQNSSIHTTLADQRLRSFRHTCWKHCNTRIPCSPTSST